MSIIKAPETYLADRSLVQSQIDEIYPPVQPGGIAAGSQPDKERAMTSGMDKKKDLQDSTCDKENECDSEH